MKALMKAGLLSTFIKNLVESLTSEMQILHLKVTENNWKWSKTKSNSLRKISVGPWKCKFWIYESTYCRIYVMFV